MTHLIEALLRDLENNIPKQDVQYYIWGKPDNISKEALIKGVIMIRPRTTVVRPISTGPKDKDDNTLEVILGKSMQTDVYQNAQIETGDKFCNRIMDGRNADGSLRNDTIRYVVRNNYKNYGILQPEIRIDYDTNEITAPDGIVTATMVISQSDLFNQIINY